MAEIRTATSVNEVHGEKTLANDNATAVTSTLLAAGDENVTDKRRLLNVKSHRRSGSHASLPSTIHTQLSVFNGTQPVTAAKRFSSFRVPTRPSDDDTEPLVDVTTGLDDSSLAINDTERPVYINGTAAAAALSKVTAQIAHVSPMHTNQYSPPPPFVSINIGDGTGEFSTTKRNNASGANLQGDQDSQSTASTSAAYTNEDCAPSTDDDDATSPVLPITEKASASDWSIVPDDRWRALIAFLLLFMAGLSNDIVLAFIHERVPSYAPLPDIVFDATTYMPAALHISEYAMLLNTVMAFTCTLLNKHRFTLLKRFFLISAMLYAGRAVSMVVTQVPVADPAYYCAPKMNSTSVLLVAERALSLVSGLGLSIGGKHVLCGDYIYSGHTVVLVHTYLVVSNYTPRRWWLLHWLSFVLSFMGVVCLLLSRGHYTVDVILAYWITSRLFLEYHTMCSVPALRHRTHGNLLSRMCWYPLFVYMEHDVPCKVPLRFDWPLPWPRMLKRSTSKSNMY